MIDPITNPDPAGWHTKVNQAVDYWNGSAVSAGLDTFGEARAAMNSLASDMGLPTVDLADSNSTKRAKMNAIIAGLGLAEGLDLYADFTTGRFWDSGPGVMASEVADTHPQPILVQSSTGYSSVGVDVLSRSDLGLQTVPSRTNKCTNTNANPTDLTNVTGTPVNEGRVTIVDDATALAVAGLSGICSSGMVFKLDNSAGVADAAVTVNGTVANTNKHTATAYIRTTGSTARVQVSGTTNASTPVAAGQAYTRNSHTDVTPTTTGQRLQIIAQPGAIVYFILNQLEEGPFATPPIITTGSAVTRTGNRQVIDLTGKLTYGVAGFVKVDLRALQDQARIIEFNDGTGTNIFHVRVDSGQYRLVVIDDTVVSAVGNIGACSIGSATLAFAFGTNYFKVRVVGASDVAADILGTLPAVSNLAIGGVGWTSSANTYQFTEQLGLIYGTPSRPINQALFDDTAYPIAEAIHNAA